MTNRDRVEEKLDIIIEKLSALEVKVATSQDEIKSVKQSVKEHDSFIWKAKGIISLISILGLGASLKAFFIK